MDALLVNIHLPGVEPKGLVAVQVLPYMVQVVLQGVEHIVTHSTSIQLPPTTVLPYYVSVC